MRVRRLFERLGTCDLERVAEVLGYVVIPMCEGDVRWAVRERTIYATDRPALREAVAWVAAVENGTPELSSQIRTRLLDF